MILTQIHEIVKIFLNSTYSSHILWLLFTPFSVSFYALWSFFQARRANTFTLQTCIPHIFLSVQ